MLSVKCQLHIYNVRTVLLVHEIFFTVMHKSLIIENFDKVDKWLAIYPIVIFFLYVAIVSYNQSIKVLIIKIIIFV